MPSPFNPTKSQTKSQTKYAVRTLFLSIIVSQGLIENAYAIFATEATQLNVLTQAITTNSLIGTTNSTLGQIDADILQVGRVLESQLKAQRASMSKLIADQNQKFKDLMVDFGKSQVRQKAIDSFGAQAVDSKCFPGQKAASLQVGEAVKRELTKKVSKKLYARNHTFNKTKDIIEDLQKIENKDVVPETVFPENLVFETADDEKKAEHLLQVMMNPVPATKLTKKEENTKSGTKYKEVLKIYDAKTFGANKVASRVFASQMATIEYDEWAKTIWDEIGSGGDYPGAVTRPGLPKKMMSVDSALDLFVKGRFENPTWYKKAEQYKGPTWVARQNLLINAARLKIEHEMLLYLKQIAFMKAQNRFEKLNNEYLTDLAKMRAEARKQNIIQ